MRVSLAYMLFLSAVTVFADTGSGASTPAPEANAVTNIYLISDTVECKAWTRQAVLATPSNTIKDLSGVFVAAAEAAVHSNAAERIVAVSQAATEGVRTAFQALYAVTGNVPDTAYHATLAIPPQDSPASLQGYVVKEESDGVTDVQWVWYSHILPVAPVRYVKYLTPSGEYTQNVKWDAWSKDGTDLTVNGRTWRGCHRCTVTRPQAARNIPALSRQNERFGGVDGFDFGASLVTVGGRPTRTGFVTNDVTGEVWRFNNGILKKGESNASEE